MVRLKESSDDDPEEDPERARPRDWRLKGSVYVALFLIGAMVRGPWLGVLLVVIGVGAAGCAALLRRMTRRSERRFEVLRNFDPDDKVH